MNYVFPKMDIILPNVVSVGFFFNKSWFSKKFISSLSIKGTLMQIFENLPIHSQTPPLPPPFLHKEGDGTFQKWL